MSDKFKLGDRVVKVSAEWDNWPALGTTVTIHKLDGDGLPWVKEPIFYESIKERDLLIELEEGIGQDCIDDRDYELEEIVNSPLWKALR